MMVIINFENTIHSRPMKPVILENRQRRQMPKGKRFCSLQVYRNNYFHAAFTPESLFFIRTSASTT